MPTFFRRLFLVALRLLAVVAGAVFAASLLAAGLIALLSVSAWSLLRGRKPVSVRWSRFSTMRPRPTRGGAGEVVDVVAREVSNPQQQLMRD